MQVLKQNLKCIKRQKTLLSQLNIAIVLNTTDKGLGCGEDQRTKLERRLKKIYKGNILLRPILYIGNCQERNY